ncbi:MAG: hypothetical protein K1X40_09095, partial [Chitinophagales bacterium]|nr:hypothetical protein [Chitinophagales bacterium]
EAPVIKTVVFVRSPIGLVLKFEGGGNWYQVSGIRYQVSGLPRLWRVSGIKYQACLDSGGYQACLAICGYLLFDSLSQVSVTNWVF